LISFSPNLIDLSTSLGVFTGKVAQSKNIGGEVLFYIC